MRKLFDALRAYLARLLHYLSVHRRISIPAAAVLLILLAFALGRGRSQPGAEFQTVKIERGTLTATVGATGTVRARQSAVLAWQSAGTVDQVSARVGERVDEGDVMATLASTSLPQNIILAQADLVEAQKALDDLLHSDTARAQALIAVQQAQDALETAQDYRDSLEGKIDLKKIVYINIGGHQIPQVKYYKGYAGDDRGCGCQAGAGDGTTGRRPARLRPRGRRSEQGRHRGRTRPGGRGSGHLEHGAHPGALPGHRDPGRALRRHPDRRPHPGRK